MFPNLLVWLLFVALLVGAVWLLVRSARAKKRAWQILGIAGSAVLILLFGAPVLLGGKGLWVMYRPAGEVPDLQVQGTPEQIQRGAYLASISCSACHGLDGDRTKPLAGGLDLGAEIPLPVGSFIAANLTPAGIVKERSDGELFRLLRYGYNGDGQISPTMATLAFRELSDEDLTSLIAYLRSLEPVESTGKRGSQPNFLAAVMVGAGMFPIGEPIHGVVTAPPKGESAEYGKYVATIGDCRACHGPDMTGTEPSMTAPNGYPNPRPLVSTWTAAEFIQAMRTGKRPSGFPLNMPWQNASYMDDQDLTALYNYLRAEPMGN